MAAAGAGAGGARLLVDGVAGMDGPRGPLRVAGERPGRARGVRDSGAHRQAEVGAVLLHLGEQRRLPAEEMRAAGQVDHQSLRRLLGHPGAELARPAAERGEKGGLARRVGRPRHEVGAERRRLAQRLAAVEAAHLGRRGERGDEAQVARLRHHGKRGLGERGLQPQGSLGSEAGEPQRQDAPGLRVGA